MSYFTQELFSIGIFSIASFVLAIVLLLVVYIISFTSKVEIEKSSAYECGFQPFSETSYPFEVQFAIIAIMFLLFDIEVLYLFPLALSLFSLTVFQMVYLAIFFAILSLGIIFEITRNILKFSSNPAIIQKDSLFLFLHQDKGNIYLKNE